MAFSVQMPALGESVTEGTVTRWLKQEGDTVERDEPLLEVSTDKVDTEIPSPAAGVLKKIVAQEDDTVEVGGELAVIGDEASGEEQTTDADGESGGDESGDEQPAQESTEEEEEKPAEEPEAQPEPAAEEPEEPDAKPAAKSSSDGKSTSVKMPELGESVTEGTVTRWLKKVGDKVEADEPLLEVSTDKVDTEIPSPVSGTLLSITAEEDDTVEVGGELAKIGEPGESGEAPAEPKPEPEAKEEPKPEAKKEEPKEEPKPEPQKEPAPAAASSNGDGTPYVTPLVRKLASENNVDLAKVKGTGVGGRIRKQDVLAAAEEAKAPAKEQPPSPRRHRPRSLPKELGAGPPARNHSEGQPHPADHREENARIFAGHSATHANPRGRHDQDRGVAGASKK